MTCIENATEKTMQLYGEPSLNLCLNQTAIMLGRCKYFVLGSFIAYPESYVSDAIVIDSALISDREQVLINDEEHNALSEIEFKSSICI